MQTVLGWPFANERPGDLCNLTIAVMDKKTVTQILVQSDALHDRTRGNLIGVANDLVRLEKGKAILELYVEGVFPLVVADVLES